MCVESERKVSGIQAQATPEEKRNKMVVKGVNVFS